MIATVKQLLHTRSALILLIAIALGCAHGIAGELRVKVLRISETCVGQKPTVTIQLENFNTSFAIQGVSGSVTIRQGPTTMATQSIGSHTLAPSQVKDVDVAVDWSAQTEGTHTVVLNAQGADNINGPQSASQTFSVCPSTPCPQRPTASASAIYVGTGSTGSIRYSVSPESCCFEIKATVVTGRSAIQSHSPDTWVAISASRDVSVTVNRTELGKGTTVLRVDWRACDRSTSGSDYVLVLDGTPSAPTLPQQPAGVTGGQTPMSGTEADPVLTATREMHVPVATVDAEVIAELPIRFNRDYLSQLEKVRPNGSGFGPNWSHSYDYAAARTENIAVVLRPNGAEAVFNRIGDRWDLAYPKSEPLSFGVEGDSISRMVDNSTGVVYEFEQFGQLSGVGLTNGYMNRIRWETPTFLTIKTPSGKGISLTTDSLGLFTTISNGGWTSSYHYNTGFLVQFRNPLPETHTTQYVYQRGKPYMTSWVTPMGRTPLTIAYDDDGRVTSQDFGEGEIYRFSGGNGTTIIQFPTGEQVEHRHDAMNRLTSIKRPDGEASFTYDASGNRTSVTDFGGGRTNRTFLRGLSRGAEYANGGGVRIDYSERSVNGLSLQDIEKVEVIGGGSTIYGRDATRGVVNLITRSGRGSTAFEYAPNSHLPSRVQDFGIDTRFTWNTDGLPATVQFRDGETLTYEYNEYNYPTRIVSSKSERTQTMTWDPMGLLRTRTSGGATERFEYDGDFLPTRFIDAVGSVTRWAYDDRGRLKEHQQPATAPLQITWKGLDVSRTQLGDYRVDYTWSWDKQSVTATDNNGITTAIRRNADGVLDDIILPGDRAVDVTADAMGRYTKITLPSGLQFSVDFDNLGNVIQSALPTQADKATWNANGTQVDYEFGGRIRVNFETSFTGRDRLTTRFTDGDNNVFTTVTDGSGTSTRTTPSGASVTTTFDEDWNPLRVDFGDGVANTYRYRLGLPVVFSSGGDSVSVEYDGASRLVQVGGEEIRRDSSGRVLGVNGVRASYNLDGSRKDVRWGMQEQTHYAYTNGRLTRIVDSKGGETNVEYNESGFIAGFIFPGAFRLGYEYDADGNVAKVSTSDGWTMEYTREHGRVTSITRSDNVPLQYPVLDRMYRYDQDNQLEGAQFDNRGNFLQDHFGVTYSWALFGLQRRETSATRVDFTYDRLGGLERIVGVNQVLNDNYNVGITLDYTFAPALPVQVDYGQDNVENYVTALGRILYGINKDGQRRFMIDDGYGNIVAKRDESGSYGEKWWYTPTGESISDAPATPSLGFGGSFGNFGIADVIVNPAGSSFLADWESGRRPGNAFDFPSFGPFVSADLGISLGDGTLGLRTAFGYNSHSDSWQPQTAGNGAFHNPLDVDYQRRLNVGRRWGRDAGVSLRSLASLGRDPGLTTVAPAVPTTQESRPFSLTTKLPFPFQYQPDFSNPSTAKPERETFSLTTKLKGVPGLHHPWSQVSGQLQRVQETVRALPEGDGIVHDYGHLDDILFGDRPIAPRTPIVREPQVEKAAPTTTTQQRK